MPFGIVDSYSPEKCEGVLWSADLKEQRVKFYSANPIAVGTHVSFVLVSVGVDVKPLRNAAPVIDDVPSDAAKAARGEFNPDYCGQYGNREAIERQSKAVATEDKD